VKTCIEAWLGGASHKWRRIAENVRTETAFSLDDFCSLVLAFAAHAERITSPERAWTEACRGFQHRGRCLSDSDRPKVLGRALPLKQYASFIHEGAGQLTPEQAEELLRQVIVDGDTPNRRRANILRRARVGRYVVWATFCKERPDRHPFEELERTASCIRTALALGNCEVTDTLVLLAYGAEGIEIRRPTIADAGDYEWYRPCSSEDEPHGWTEPLSPNPGGLAPQPEVVHGEVLGATLVFPIYSTQP
jgi:hypothetical protein